jgi:hypothetical protein
MPNIQSTLIMAFGVIVGGVIGNQIFNRVA